MSWAGSVGEYTVALTQGLGSVMGDGLALALAWAATVDRRLTFAHRQLGAVFDFVAFALEAPDHRVAGVILV